MINQDDLSLNLNSNSNNQNSSSLLSQFNLPSLSNFDFDHQKSLAFLAQDLLNEANKFSSSSTDLNLNLNDIESDCDEDDINNNNDDDNDNDDDQDCDDADTNTKPNKVLKRKRPQKQKDSDLSKSTNNGKKKAKTQYQRKNIKKIIGDEKLNESTLRALQDEQERQMRLKIDSFQSTFNPQDASASASSSDQSILVLDEDTPDLSTNNLVKKLDSISRLNNTFLKQENTNLADVEDLTQSDNDVIEDYDYQGKSYQDEEDDDCRILTESEHQQEEAFKKKNFRGIHMNDDLNRPDTHGQVLVNVNHPVEDPDIYLLPFLAKNIKSHQIGGIRFIYDNIVESLTRVKDKSTGFGCILAHAMGLGKTFQLITFIEVFLRCTCSKRVLCIVPINTIQNWLSEFNNWLPENGQQRLDNDTIMNYKRPFKVFLINDYAKTLKQRTEIILDWKMNGGVLLIGYEMFRTLVSVKTTGLNSNKQLNEGKLSKKNSAQTLIKYLKQNQDLSLVDLEYENQLVNRQNELEEALLTPCLVVCDEGHRIKNSSANIAKTLQRIKTKRRVVLTGYPLQNNLIEYWCMVDFVRPSYLGNKSEFSNMFERPIMNGQCVDSTRDDAKLMRYRAHVLHSLLEGFVQRRGHDVFLSSLPKKHEFIVLLKLSPAQKELYLAFMQAIGAMNPGEKTNPLRTFAICCKIWNHPDVLYKYNQNRESDLDLDLPEINNQQQPSTTINTQKAKKQSNNSNNSPQYIQTSSSCVVLEDGGFNPFAQAYSDSRYGKFGFDPDWANRLLETYKPGLLENGAKLMLSFSIIEESVRAGDKILLFSQSLLTLNLIEEYLQRFNVPNLNQKWQKNKSYFRLDGSTAGIERERLINSFNKQNNGLWLFLLSTRAGCLGINLIGANRVIVLDASWNPCHDAQAVCRVYRYGQPKHSYIYRLIADHTMEKKIYDRQISKQTMSDRVVDEIQSENHFTRTEVEKLIHFVREDEPVADLTNLPYKYEDHVLVNSCLKHANVITREPFTHESLLIDKKEYQLSEREKALAFREYNHDKKYFPYSRSNSSYSSFYYNRYQSQMNSQLSQLQPGNYSNSVYPNSTSSSMYSVSNSSSSSSTASSTSVNAQQNNLDFQLNRSLSTSLLQAKCQPQVVEGQNQTKFITNDPSQSLSQLKDVKITSFVASSQIVIPTSDANNQQPVLVQPGEKVYILKTPKGCYLRTPDKRYIALRNKSIEESIIGNSSETTNTSQSAQSNYQPVVGYQGFGSDQFQNNGFGSQIYGNESQNSNLYQSFNQNQMSAQSFSNVAAIGQSEPSNYYYPQAVLGDKQEEDTSASSAIGSSFVLNDLALLSADNFQNQMISLMQQSQPIEDEK